jgi:signal transduction histidine kinase
MGQANLNLFFITSTTIILLFIAGIVMFIFQYRKRKVLHEKEKQLLYEQYQTELLNSQLEMQQQTMQHIGREIHDNVGQKLTLASLYSRQLVQSQNPEKISAIGGIIDEALAELRLLSKTLTSPMPVQDDILLLLQHEAEQINKSGLCNLQVECMEPGINLATERKNTLFRLLQEFIQNSLKHAQCRRISITLRKTENKLYITATDDGIGFNVKTGSKGIGLQNMQGRAEQLNARYEFSSVEEKGTLLNLQLSLVE